MRGGRAPERAFAGWLPRAGPMGFFLGALLAVMGVPGLSAAATDVEVTISAPADGAVVAGDSPLVRVEGWARARHDYPIPRYDIMLIIDISGSTGGPSGVNLNARAPVGEGSATSRPGVPSVGGPSVPIPGHSILAAEVVAGERLLARLDARATRVGVVTFSGPLVGRILGVPFTRGKQNATLGQPLTSDFGAVRLALRKVLRDGPYGGTDMAAGIRLAVRELAGLSGHVSDPDPGSRKIAVLLTDGYPTLPFGGGTDMDPRDVEVAVNAARVAAKAGITIHTFGLGEEALSAPLASIEIARVTGGRYTPIQTPGRVVEVIEKTSFTDVDLVVLTNLTTGEGAKDVAVTAEGFFTGEVRLVPGPNRIGVNVLASDGTKAGGTIVVHYRRATHLDLDLSRQNQELELELKRLRERTRTLELELKRQQEEPAGQAGEAERQRRLELEILRRETAPAPR